MAAQVHAVDGVPLCIESFGRADDPVVVLATGQAASMLWWDERLCRLLAAGGRRVVRFDLRDTGRSVAYPPGRPGYDGADLADDLLRVADAVGARRVHLVGISMGGALAQVAALAAPERVASLTLLMTSPAGPGDRGLPGVDPAYLERGASPAPAAPTTRSPADATVAEVRALAGERPLHEAEVRRLVERDRARAVQPASLGNHLRANAAPRWRERLPLIAAPTLVVAGSADPLFGVAHGAALAREIRGARLLVLAGAGHVLLEPDWAAVVSAVLLHTAGRP